MMSDLFSLQGKRILVTGSTRGIGLLLAQGLAEHGAEVIIHGTKPEQAQAVAEQLAEKGFKTHALAFDVTDSQAVRQAIDFIENNIGAIDVLVNNAGIQRQRREIIHLQFFPCQQGNSRAGSGIIQGIMMIEGQL